MKAIHLTAYGDVLLFLLQNSSGRSFGTRRAVGGEALVRREYAPINDSDLLLANEVYFLNPKRFICHRR